MIVRIHKGNHSPGIIQRIRQSGIVNGNNIMQRVVTFGDSCLYDLGHDSLDVNKLFGYGYIKGGHHEDSARFGWNCGNGRINLFAYCYVDGERLFKTICNIATHIDVLLTISNLKTRYSFTVQDAHNTWYVLGDVTVPFYHHKKWAYKLGAYFGGNNSAPHDITIKISKK